MQRGKGQAWSMDLVIGLVIFMVAIGITYSLLGSLREEDPAPLRIESEVVAIKLTSDASLKVAEGNQLDMARLGELAQRTDTDGYEALKQEFGVSDEFCIYLQDDEGNLVYIEGPDGEKYTGIGSGTDDVLIGNTPCGEPTT